MFVTLSHLFTYRGDIRHIYREFNQTADALSNQAIDERDTNVPSHFGGVW